MIEGIATIGEIVAEIIPALDPENRERCPVIRTTKTEDRAPIERALRIEIYKRDHFRCVWCGREGRLELDHIVPWSAGGSDDFDNLRTLCHGCNEYRSNFANPVDDGCRRLPGGYECVYCAYDDVAEEVLTPIYCRTCRHKAAGIPGIAAPAEQWRWEVA